MDALAPALDLDDDDDLGFADDLEADDLDADDDDLSLDDDDLDLGDDDPLTLDDDDDPLTLDDDEF